MRNLEEIKLDIEATNKKISGLKDELTYLYRERADAEFAQFCEKHGVKKGDIVRTEFYRDVQVIGVDPRYSTWVTCRKIKKNGEPYHSCISLNPACFDNCKVIGHKAV